MRIIVIHNHYQDKGGEDVVFAQEVHALRSLHTVETLTFQNRTGWRGLLQFALYPWNIFAVNKALGLIKSFKPDVVHVHNTHYALGPLLFRALHKRGIHVVTTLHNFRLLDPSASLFYQGAPYLPDLRADFPWSSVHKKVLDNSLLKTFWTAFTYYLHKKLGTWQMVSRYLVLSHFAKDLILKSSLGIEASRITIKPNFAPVLASPSPAPTRGNHFIYIGRLSVEKGISPLLKSFAHSTSTIKIYGDGPLRSEVEQYAQQYPNIKFEGYQHQEVLTQALLSCQALIVPSICYEGMPLSVLEAFALGTPVLASKIGVLGEMVQEHQQGLQFEPNNPQSLSQALSRWNALTESEKTEISKNCHNAYLDRYSQEKNVLLLQDIYQDILEKHNL